MGGMWKTVPLFISSMSLDMHAERDHQILKVYLREIEQKMLAEWKALPWWKRIRQKKPEK